MSISPVDKMKINKYFKETALNRLSYNDMCHKIGSRQKFNYVDFLGYLTDYVVENFRKGQNISIKNLTKYIVTIESNLEWLDEEKIEVKEEILDKIRSFKELYDEYINRTGEEIDKEFNDEFLTSILKTIDKLYPDKLKKDSVGSYINKIATLEEELKKLTKKLNEINILYNDLKDNYTKKASKLVILGQEVNTLGTNVNIKERKIADLDARINELENSLKGIQQENIDLLPYKEQYEMLFLETKKLRDLIDKENSVKEDASNLKIKKLKVQDLIYQKLLFEQANIDEILKYVEEQGFVSSKDEIYDFLKEIRKVINIEQKSFSLSPNYKIVAPTIKENGEFVIDISNGCKYYDIMLVADFHLRNFDDTVIKRFHILNDYCVQNGINLILNLGDFFESLGRSHLRYTSALKNYKLTEEAMSLIPKANGLYHAILGGNHDKKIIKYGFDAIDYLATEREDIINLGYTHSTIKFTNSSHNIGCFDIHHPDDFNFAIDFDNNGIDLESMDRYLRKIYNEQGRNRNDSYIDIFGHTHKSQFNYPGSYCYVPPYFGMGAVHLRIYFNEKTKINYMVFMPLSLSSKLKKTNEIVYQKIIQNKFS